MDLSNFIPYYPDSKDPEYASEMGSMLEFQELLENPSAIYANDPFFYNYQVFVGRIMSPATNNNCIMIRWDPGVGKTRGAFRIALEYIRNSNFKKALFLSSAKIIQASIRKEVTQYYGHDFKGPKDDQEEESAAGNKKKRHGKSTSATRRVKQLGITPITVVTFMNELIGFVGKKIKASKKVVPDAPPANKLLKSSRKRGLERIDQEDNDDKKQWQEYLNKPEWKLVAREKYKNHIIIVDEVHLFRQTGIGKRNFEYLIALLDTLRDICPIILITGTPIVDTWVDMFSVLSMLLSKEDRDVMFAEINHIFGVKGTNIVNLANQHKFPNKDKLNKLSNIITKYGLGKISDRSSSDIVPTALPLPEILDNVDITGKKYTVISNNFDPSLWDSYIEILREYIEQYDTEPTFTTSYNDFEIGKWLAYQKIGYNKLSASQQEILLDLTNNIDYTPEEEAAYSMDNTDIREYIHFAYMSPYQASVIAARIHEVGQRFNTVIDKDVIDLYLTKDSTNEDININAEKGSAHEDIKREAAYNSIRQLYEFVYPKLRIKRKKEYSLRYTLIPINIGDYFSTYIGIPLPLLNNKYVFDIDILAMRTLELKSINDTGDTSMIYIDDNLIDIIPDINNHIEYIDSRSVIARSTLQDILYNESSSLDSALLTKQAITLLERFSDKLQQMYPYTIDVDDYTTSADLVSMDPNTGTYFPSQNATINQDENIYKLYKDIDSNGNEYIVRDKGIAKYSAKCTEVLTLLSSPALIDLPGYIHTLWVSSGTINVAAALVENGWEQYTGKKELKTPGIKPRFALIHGESGSETNINNIIEAFNSADNRDGKILRIIVGSKKSGISISFDNARFFLALSPDFNKTTHIQAEARVFRASSLTHLPKDKRTIYVADIIAIPIPNSKALIQDLQNGLILNKEYKPDFLQDEEGNDIIFQDEDGNDIVDEEGNYIPADENGNEIFPIVPFTTEISMYVVAEQKYMISASLMKALNNASVETMVLQKMKDKSTITRNHALMYGRARIEDAKLNIINDINDKWYSYANINDMYIMQAAASMISSKSLVTTRYGMLRQVKSVGNTLAGMSSSNNTLSLVYDNNFFLVNQDKSYGLDEIISSIDYIHSLPNTEYEFNIALSNKDKPYVKVLALELSLSIIKVNNVSYTIKNPYRTLILNLYQQYWTVFPVKNNRNITIGGDMVHILWCSIKPNSHMANMGVKPKREMKTRMLSFIESENTIDRWKYIDSVDKESIYLTALTSIITDTENAVIEIAKSLHLDYYVHLSLYNGELLYRQIKGNNDKNSSRKKPPVLQPEAEYTKMTCTLLKININEYNQRIKLDSFAVKKDIYMAAKRLNILVIR